MVQLSTKMVMSQQEKTTKKISKPLLIPTIRIIKVVKSKLLGLMEKHLRKMKNLKALQKRQKMILLLRVKSLRNKKSLNHLKKEINLLLC